MAVKLARYTPEADADGIQEYPAQLLPVQPGDLVLNPSALYSAADALPGFTGFVTETGAPWV